MRMKANIFILASTIVLASGAVHASPNERVITETGTTFEDVSNLLAPYTRKGFDGQGGFAWLDYDADNDLDLLLTGGIGSKNGLFRNNNDGTFTDVSAESGIDVGGHGGVVAGDIDNDGYPDVYLSREGTIFGLAQNTPRFFHNNGDGTFTDISVMAGISGQETTASPAMADINNDGYLDLFVAAAGHRHFIFPPAKQTLERLYLNNGDLTFTDITDSAGVASGLGSCVASFSYYDDDEWIDLFYGDCNNIDGAQTPFHIFRNNGDNTFVDVREEAGLGLGHWMSSTLGDYDNDGDIDLFATSFGPLSPLGIIEAHALYRNNGDGTYTDVATEELAVNQFSFGATFADWDNDGWLDLFYTGSQDTAGLIGPNIGNPGHMFFNDGAGNLIENNDAHGLDLRNILTSSVAKADYDQDGFLDLAIFASAYQMNDIVSGEPIGDDGAPFLLKNEGNGNTGVTIRPHGDESNKMAIGAKMWLYTHDLTQVREIYAGGGFLTSESPWPHFGMGKDKIGMLKVRWPSGLKEKFIVRSNRVLDIYEGEGIPLPKHERGHDEDES